jgi:hypothetical protein
MRFVMLAAREFQEDFAMRLRVRISLLAIFALLSAAASFGATLTVPAGTTLTVRMADPLDSDKNHAGETFRARVEMPVTVDGKTVVPQGAEAIGRVVYVAQSGRFRGRPVIMMELTALNFDGRSIAILTGAHQEQGDSQGKQTATTAGAGGAIGTVVGAIAGGAPGFLIGAGIGAASGAVVQAVRGPQPVRIPAESLMLFTLQSPVSVETGL